MRGWYYIFAIQDYDFLNMLIFLFASAKLETHISKQLCIW